jgi:uncharacterized protein
VAATKDNPALERYELETEGGLAFLDYHRRGSVVTLLHAEVPPQLRGRGFGSALVRGALELVRERGDKVIARCPFVAAYLKRHPSLQDLLAKPL